MSFVWMFQNTVCLIVTFSEIVVFAGADAYHKLTRMSPAVSVFSLSAATNSSFHDIVTASLVVRHSLLSARWPETLCLTISATQHLVMTSLELHWRHTFSPSIRTRNALEASCVTALYKCTITYLLTYLLTYVLSPLSVGLRTGTMRRESIDNKSV